MNPYEPPRRSLAVCFAGAAFFAFFMGMTWTVVTIIASQQGVDTRQQETIGYTMIIMAPLASLVGAVAGFAVGFFGDPTRWLRRWTVLGAVGAALAVAFNVWMVHDSAPENRHPPPQRPAPVAPSP